MRGVRKYVLLGMLFPGLAWGADVRLSLQGAAEYDSNIARSEDNAEDDLVFRVTPAIRLVEDREKLNYSVGYQLPYEIGVTHGSVNDLNQLFDGNFRYRATPQTEVYGNNNFYYVRGLFSQDENLQNASTGQVGDDRDRILQNDLLLGTRHQFTPRLSGTVEVENGYYDTNQFARANVLSFGGSLSGDYLLTPHHVLGGGFSYSRQQFQDTFNRPASDTNYYNIFGSWTWLFDETTTFKVQAGPAIIDSSQDAAPSVVSQRLIPFQELNDGSVIVFESAPALCPTMRNNGVDQQVLFNNAGTTCQQIFIPATDPAAARVVSEAPGDNPFVDVPYLAGSEPESVSDTRVTLFASASLTKRWTPNLASSVSYVRQENQAAGIDGGAVLDGVTLNNTWRITERWDFSARVDWTLRQSATDGARIFLVPGPSSVGYLPANVASSANVVQIDSADSLDTQRWGTSARLAYRLTRNTVTALQYTYNKQNSNGDTVGQESDFDNHLVTFTVQYNFEPIGLPW